MGYRLLAIHVIPEVSLVEVQRGENIPEAFWLQLRAQWGSDGRRAGVAVQVPLERFLSNMAWLGPACRRHGIGIAWDESSRRLVQQLSEERRVLTAILEEHVQEPAEDTVRIQLPGFKRELFDFQHKTVRKLLALPHGANFSVPGAGKTTVTYALFHAERLRGRVDRMLVVAPLSAFGAWADEALECFSIPPQIQPYTGGPVEANTEVLLVNYQRLVANYAEVSEWVRGHSTQVVLDEAHRMKRGWAGQWGSTCLNLAYLAIRRDVLTGTPAPQGPDDLRTLFGFLWPGQASRIMPSRRPSRGEHTRAASSTGRSIQRLFVRTAKHELNLTPPIFEAQVIPLSGLHAEIYRALLNQYVGQFALGKADRATFAQMGQVVMYLLEAATNPALLVAGSSPYDPVVFTHPPLPIPPESPLRQLLVDYHRYETPAKFRQLGRIIERNASLSRKTLVWSTFVRNLQTLERMLARFRPAVVHGGIPSEMSGSNAPRTREKELARFQHDSECMVLLANPAATGEGISLHHVCHDAVYLDRTFNAGQYLQSVDRIHRLGLSRDEATRVTFLLSEHTIDERVDSRVREKAEILSGLLEDPDIVTMALPDEDDYGTVLDSSEDLEALFAHLRGAD